MLAPCVFLFCCLQLLVASMVEVISDVYDGRASNKTGFGFIGDFVASLDVGDIIASEITEHLRSSPEVADFLSDKTEIKKTTGLVHTACFISKLVFDSEAFHIGEDVEQDVERSWSQTCWFNPACVVRPDSATGVSKIIKIVAFLHVEFAVRSGGHSPNPGWSSIDSGILIDLGRLNRTTVTSSQEVAQVGPGAKWSDVIEYLDPYSLTVLGGRVPSVGVGGLILGGGVSHFTAEYGLVADTLKNVEVVLADGTIVNANPNQNADLFWALKGGGPNFGIVTRFDLATVPINNLWFQSTTHAPDQATAILEAFAEWQNNDDPKGSTIIVITNTFCNIGLVYSAPVELPPCFRPFYDIPVLQTAVPSIKASVLNLSNIIAAASPPTPIRHDYRGASSKVDIQLYKEVHAFWAAKTAEVSAATGANMTFVVQHIPKSAVDAGNRNGGNPLGLESITQQWWTSIMDWTSPEHDELVRGVGIATTRKWKELGQLRASHLPFVYMNDASRDQNPLATYPQANLARLKAIARKYDRTGVFQTLQKEGFLLSKL